MNVVVNVTVLGRWWLAVGLLGVSGFCAPPAQATGQGEDVRPTRTRTSSPAASAALSRCAAQ